MPRAAWSPGPMDRPYGPFGSPHRARGRSRRESGRRRSGRCGIRGTHRVRDLYEERTHGPVGHRRRSRLGVHPSPHPHAPGASRRPGRRRGRSLARTGTGRGRRDRRPVVRRRSAVGRTLLRVERCGRVRHGTVRPPPRGDRRARARQARADREAVHHDRRRGRGVARAGRAIGQAARDRPQLPVRVLVREGGEVDRLGTAR